MSAVATRRLLSALVAAILAAPLFAQPLLAQEAQSAAAAKELASLLADRKLDAVATRMPGETDKYAAVLAFPNQLLVVWARYAAPAVLNEKLIGKQYRDIYIDLNSASIAGTKVLITDLGADGLRPKRDRDEPYDTQDAGKGGFNFDGNWKEDKLSEEDYMKVYAEADAGYKAALEALIAEIKKS